MLKTALLTFVISGLAAAQATPAPLIPPPPPACLSGPVSTGNVTLTCTALDGTNNTPGDNSNVLGNYYFQVRITSSDPDVVGVRVKLTSWQGAFQPGQRSAAITATGNTFVYIFALGAGQDSAGQQIAPVVSGIQVQELKASSSQSF